MSLSPNSEKKTLFPDGCSLTNPKHIDITLPLTHFNDIRGAICWEFILFFLILIIILFVLSPKFQIWVIIIGCYFVISLVLGMISIVSFGILFSFLYLIDRTLSTQFEDKTFGYKHFNEEDED